MARFPVMNKRTLDSKVAYRKKLAALPIGEKLRIVESLAERIKLIRGLKKKGTQP